MQNILRCLPKCDQRMMDDEGYTIDNTLFTNMVNLLFLSWSHVFTLYDKYYVSDSLF